MIDREDIVFATCYQLAQLISADWDDQSAEVKAAIEVLKPFDEPGEVFWGVPPIVNPLKLTASETEPESIHLGRKLMELKTVAHIFKVIMQHSDGWQTPDSSTLKKEIVSRIHTYEKEAERILTRESEECHISL